MPSFPDAPLRLKASEFEDAVFQRLHIRTRGEFSEFVLPLETTHSEALLSRYDVFKSAWCHRIKVRLGNGCTYRYYCKELVSHWPVIKDSVLSGHSNMDQCTVPQLYRCANVWTKFNAPEVNNLSGSSYTLLRGGIGHNLSFLGNDQVIVSKWV